MPAHHPRASKPRYRSSGEGEGAWNFEVVNRFHSSYAPL
ncbi:hypothetical protein DAD186_13680 [Dermabacter vaginalis]|uniref:Uncharacterized protein n=1 Tax=Dermabacter vaginalis TaxID=1630135 RepID=A0A1B0ZIY7_9MICO|nr:hypothetical protein DAD186_13680 [Dermabacter vaginalis]